MPSHRSGSSWIKDSEGSPTQGLTTTSPIGPTSFRIIPVLLGNLISYLYHGALTLWNKWTLGTGPGLCLCECLQCFEYGVQGEKTFRSGRGEDISASAFQTPIHLNHTSHNNTLQTPEVCVKRFFSQLNTFFLVPCLIPMGLFVFSRMEFLTELSILGKEESLLLGERRPERMTQPPTSRMKQPITR